MRSSDLARQAGVSVRALRHYHHIGLLPEPDRGANGYRSYDFPDLIRVLRIKRMAAVGIPLDRMPALLDAGSTADSTAGSTVIGSGGAGHFLDELDQELASEIARLTRQRALIAELRSDQTPPDLPPQLARFLAASDATGLSPKLAQINRDQSVLLAHLVGDDGMPSLASFYERISDPQLAQASTDFTERFDRLGPDASDDDIDAFVEEFATAFAPLISEFSGSEPPIDLGASAGVFSEYVAGVLNAQQQRVLEHLESRLARLARLAELD